jgi:general secretion pathway protein A
MYHGFYGLREPPFELAPNPEYLYLTPRHAEALSLLQYGLVTAKSVTVLIGEAGTGKTTLLKAALESDRCRSVRSLHLVNPTLTRNEFMQTLARGFGLTTEAAASKAVLLSELDDLVRARRSQGEITALIVDEAHTLSVGLLEEVRLLGNIETTTEKLLPLVLIGQPELGRRLEEPGLRQLKQRVSLRCEITPFSQSETAAYIFTRIAAAGGAASALFTREAVTMIHEHSSGIPRTISVLCDNALITGMALGRRPIDAEIVSEVVADFRLGRRPGSGGRALIEQRPGVPDRSHQTAPIGTSPPANDSTDRREADDGTLWKRRFAIFRAGRA